MQETKQTNLFGSSVCVRVLLLCKGMCELWWRSIKKREWMTMMMTKKRVLGICFILSIDKINNLFITISINKVKIYSVTIHLCLLSVWYVILTSHEGSLLFSSLLLISVSYAFGHSLSLFLPRSSLTLSFDRCFSMLFSIFHARQLCKSRLRTWKYHNTMFSWCLSVWVSVECMYLCALAGFPNIFMWHLKPNFIPMSVRIHLSKWCK